MCRRPPRGGMAPTGVLLLLLASHAALHVDAALASPVDRLRALSEEHTTKACTGTFIIASKQSKRFDKTGMVSKVVRSLVDEACGFAEWMVEYKLGLPLVVEVGGGRSTATVEHALAKGCRVMAFDPSRAAADRIAAVAAGRGADGYRLVHQRQAVAGVSRARAPFHEAVEYRDGGHDGLAGHAPDVWWDAEQYTVRDVEVVTLDVALREEPLVLVLLLDVHGWDVEALEGATDLVDTHRVQNVVFKLWPRGMRDANGGVLPRERVRALLHRMHRRGYYLYHTRLKGHAVGDVSGVGLPQCVDQLLDFLDATAAIDPSGMWVDIVAVKG